MCSSTFASSEEELFLNPLESFPTSSASSIAPPFDLGLTIISKSHVTQITRLIYPDESEHSEVVLQEIIDVAPSIITVIDDFFDKNTKINNPSFDYSMDTYDLPDWSIYDSYILPEAALVVTASLYFDPNKKEEEPFHSSGQAYQIKVSQVLTKSLSSMEVQNLSGRLLETLVNKIKLKDYKEISFNDLNLEKIENTFGLFEAGSTTYVRDDLYDEYSLTFKNNFNLFIEQVEQTGQQESGLSFTAKGDAESIEFTLSHQFLGGYFSYKTNITSTEPDVRKKSDAFYQQVTKDLASSKIGKATSLEYLSVESLINKAVTRFKELGIEARLEGEDKGQYAIYYKENTKVYAFLLENVETIAEWFKANKINKLIINPDRFFNGVAYQTQSYRKDSEVSLNAKDFKYLGFSWQSQDTFFEHLETLSKSD